MTDEITMKDLIVRVKNNLVCYQCGGRGFVIVEGRNHPMPCDVCRGVGQLSIGEIPAERLQPI